MVRTGVRIPVGTPTTTPPRAPRRRGFRLEDSRGDESTRRCWLLPARCLSGPDRPANGDANGNARQQWRVFLWAGWCDSAARAVHLLRHGLRGEVDEGPGADGLVAARRVDDVHRQ